MTSLGQMFNDARGKPVPYQGHTLIRMDRLPIHHGRVDITFEPPQAGPVHQGIALKSPEGHLLLGDGSTARLLFVWNLPQLPVQVSYPVSCPAGELRVWNIYKDRAFENDLRADYWTGSASMKVTPMEGDQRLYQCGDGYGDFSLTDLVFTIAWTETPPPPGSTKPRARPAPPAKSRLTRKDG
jgi:hypothetical protein